MFAHVGFGSMTVGAVESGELTVQMTMYKWFGPYVQLLVKIYISGSKTI